MGGVGIVCEWDWGLCMGEMVVVEVLFEIWWGWVLGGEGEV